MAAYSSLFLLPLPLREDDDVVCEHRLSGRPGLSKTKSDYDNETSDECRLPHRLSTPFEGRGLELGKSHLVFDDGPCVLVLAVLIAFEFLSPFPKQKVENRQGQHGKKRIADHAEEDDCC